MSRLKSPPEKKRAEYDRDHRTAMDAPHAFRKNWPKKKARRARVYRRVADSKVQAVLKGRDSEELVIPSRVRGSRLRKTGVGSLREAVAWRETRRQTWFLPRYVLRRYEATKHSVVFKRFLSTLVNGRTELSAQRAAHLSHLLDARLTNNSLDLSTQKWLRTFFSTAPQWEARVRTWIKEATVWEKSRRRRTRG